MAEDSKLDEWHDAYMKRGTKEDFRQFLWNPEKREVLGRTGKRWAQLLLFYIIFYGTLTALFAVSLQMFYLTRGTDRPTYNFYDNSGHPMLQVPGLGMRPRLLERKFSPEMKFSASDSDSYSEYVSSIRDYLKGNYTTKSTAVKSCDGKTSESCPFDQLSLGECDGVNDVNFGYSTGEPCVLLKINRIIGWVPETDDSNANISVSCELDKALEKGDDKGCSNCLGSPEYYPSAFPVKCFPYCGVESSPDYHSPIVIVKFKGIATNGETVKVLCKANAKDFEHTSVSVRDKALSIRFSLTISL